jgi:NAD(P)H-hydrate repair Nnr-like enzyme with NAD(P)H-hydrate epimerase domain
MASPTLRPVTSSGMWPLHGREASRRIEQDALGAEAPHALMRRAGASVARLALAIAPHARSAWIAAGPGNNGGDGLEAAIHLLRAGRHVVVTLLGDAARLPADAGDALSRARDAGVTIGPALPAGSAFDLAVDALLGMGATRAPQDLLSEAIERLNAQCCLWTCRQGCMPTQDSRWALPPCARSTRCRC